MYSDIMITKAVYMLGVNRGLWDATYVKSTSKRHIYAVTMKLGRVSVCGIVE